MKTPKPNLRDRITIKEPLYLHIKGEDAKVYSIITGGADVPAYIKSMGMVSTTESIRSGRPEGKQEIEFVIRDDVTILSQYQIDYRGFTWQVQGFPMCFGPRDRYQVFTAIRTDAEDCVVGFVQLTSTVGLALTETANEQATIFHTWGATKWGLAEISP